MLQTRPHDCHGVFTPKWLLFRALAQSPAAETPLYCDFRNSFPKSESGAARRRLEDQAPYLRWARACPALVGRTVLSPPPSKPKTFEQETAC